MTARRLLCLIALGLQGSPRRRRPSSAAPHQAGKDGGILRMGTTNPFDSMNPFVAFNAISYVAFTNIYPTLVQYDTHFKITGDWATSWKTSKDGLTWTFTLTPGKWSDGTPADRRRRGLDGQPRSSSTRRRPDRDARAVPLARDEADGAGSDHARDPLRQGRRERPAAAPAVLRAAAPRLGAGRRRQREGPQELRPRRAPRRSSAAAPSSSRSTTRRARRSSQRNPGFYGPKPHVEAVGITWFAELRRDARRAQEQRHRLRRRGAADRRRPARKSGDIQVVTGPGTEVRDFGFNSNPKKKKNRELLDPKLRGRALARVRPQADRRRRLPRPRRSARDAC